MKLNELISKSEQETLELYNELKELIDHYNNKIAFYDKLGTNSIEKYVDQFQLDANQTNSLIYMIEQYIHDTSKLKNLLSYDNIRYTASRKRINIDKLNLTDYKFNVKLLEGKEEVMSTITVCGVDLQHAEIGCTFIRGRHSQYACDDIKQQLLKDFDDVRKMLGE